jgi:hypothetical protein
MLNRLRKAGEFLRNKDQAYADAVADLIRKHAPESHKGPLMMTSTAPLFNTKLDLQGATGKEALLGRAMQAGVIGTSALSRYALPAGGAVLGVKGAFDLSQGLYNAAAQTPVFGANPADEQSTLMVSYIQ